VGKKSSRHILPVFAHHKGEYIPAGFMPTIFRTWKTYEQGCLELKDSLSLLIQIESGKLYKSGKKYLEKLPAACSMGD